jgi:pyruvate,water dikinase
MTMHVTMTPKNGSLKAGVPGMVPSSQEEAPAYVVWFESLSRGDTSIAGGKGANLGELTRAGMPVPRGFVITSEAFRASIKAIGPS